MRAWMIESQSGSQALKQVEVEKPVATGTEILVRMTAPGVVPFDVAIINDENEPGFPPSSLPLVPGNQGAGVVEDAGTCLRLKAGDRVMFGAFPYGFMRAGSWAEYCTVEQDHAWKIPDSVSDGAAAQASVAYPTAYRALVEAGFAAGKTVLAPGIGGSVGNAAYQLARALGAATVIGTTSSSAKAEQARAAGFENVIDLSRQSMAEGVHVRRLPADTVVFISANAPNRDLHVALQGRNTDLRIVGDANSPRFLQTAIREGHMAGATI